MKFSGDPIASLSGTPGSREMPTRATTRTHAAVILALALLLSRTFLQCTGRHRPDVEIVCLQTSGEAKIDLSPSE